jgi:two-component system response regulator (stage 0 sporulation protein A)
MFTLEQKVDLIMRYIATTNPAKRSELKKAVVDALKDDDVIVTSVTRDDASKLDPIIMELLRKLGMPANVRGYNYSLRAIQLCVVDPSYIREITKRLYVDIAACYNTTPSRVERGIRHAVEKVFDRGDEDYIYKVFGNTLDIKKGKLTNSEFIAASANEITLQMNEHDE